MIVKRCFKTERCLVGPTIPVVYIECPLRRLLTILLTSGWKTADADHVARIVENCAAARSLQVSPSLMQ